MRLFFSVLVGGCFLFGGWFCVLFGFVVLVLFLVSNCLIPFSSHKAVEFFRSQWKGTGLTPGLMSWCAEYLYVSLTWTAGILEICCSLRGKKVRLCALLRLVRNVSLFHLRRSRFFWRWVVLCLGLVVCLFFLFVACLCFPHDSEINIVE